MADEQHRSPLFCDVVHFAQALLCERTVSDREHFIHYQYFRLQVSRHREGQSQVHSTRVMFDRSVDKLFDLGEGDDLIELISDLTELHAEYRPVEIDVFTAAQFGVKPGAYFEQAADSTVKINLSGRRLGNTREYFE